jgi:hypothetical protein
VWLRVLLIVAVALGPAFAAHAERKTVCTITVNSDDEKETFRKRLPPGQYDFVELVEKGRAEWLQSSCRRRVQCDVLVVSGHFNAGDDFYSDRLENHEYLRVDELERAACSDSCPALFSHLKEVYLFGCESLNPEATRNATHGESSRERMRRIFAHVPVIYGFSSSAPVGPTAAMLLNRYFDSGPSEIGTGRVSQRLLRTFSRNNISHARGSGGDPVQAAYRAQICQLFDDRLTPARKLAAIHRMMQGDRGDARAVVDRIEKLLGSLTDADRSAPEFHATLARIGADERTGERVLATARATSEPAMRVRLLSLAFTLGWLTPDEHRAEQGRMISELVARNAMGFAEVDLVCALGRDHALEGQIARVAATSSRSRPASRAAALACMGSATAHAEAVRALSSPDVRDVQVAQAYLRNRPITDPAEIRAVAESVTRMPASEAQVRAFETLGRLRIADRVILDDLAQAFAEAKSIGVQRAIAEVFIRSGARPPELAAVLRRHRLPSGKGDDLIDELIRRLQG